MNWIDKLFPVITLLLGWGLSEFGKYSSSRKNDRKKLKKLLFNLLELRWLLKKEIALSKQIGILIERLKVKLISELGGVVFEETESIKPMITELLKNKIVDPTRIKEIESNIDITINELAEIYPVFAYELSGRYKIKERLEKAENYFKEVSSRLEEMPKEFTDWIQPKLSNELLIELDSYIVEIAAKINRKTKNQVSHKILMENDVDTEEMDKFIGEYVEKIKLWQQSRK